MVILFWGLFFKVFLKTREKYPYIDKLIKYGIVWPSLFSGIFPVFGDYTFSTYIFFIIASYTSIVLLFVSVYSYFKKSRSSIYLIMGFSLFSFGVIVIDIHVGQ